MPGQGQSGWKPGDDKPRPKTPKSTKTSKKKKDKPIAFSFGGKEFTS